MCVLLYVGLVAWGHRVHIGDVMAGADVGGVRRGVHVEAEPQQRGEQERQDERALCGLR